MKAIYLIAFAALIPSIASAHIVFTAPVASGDAYVTSLRVSHGCKGSPTTALRVQVPEGVTVTAQDKAGWTMAVERSGGRITAITWTGHVAGDQPDTFPMSVSPNASGPVYFPVVQTCENGSVRWADIPAAGQTVHDVANPAPVFDPKAADMSGMAGMHMGH